MGASHRNCTTDSDVVSIIIPTYNRRKFLATAVDSCLRQTWPSIEIIIVDDGSTDGTSLVVDELLESTWRNAVVRYVRQDNKGASAARNLGLNLSVGAFVQFLDSDDELSATKIERQVTALRARGSERAACCICLGRTGRSGSSDAGSGSCRIGDVTDDPATMLRVLASRKVHAMQTTSPLWRHEFLAQRSGWREDLGLGDDLEFHARMLRDADQLSFIDEELFFVREHRGPRLSVGELDKASLLSQIEARRTVFGALKDRGIWDARSQRDFLRAMRTLYANALALGDRSLLRSLERWLIELARSPTLDAGVPLMVIARRIFGSRVLLLAHRAASGFGFR